MKIETLKSINYSRGTHTLRVLVLAANQLLVTNALVGKEELHLYTDNEEKEQEVDVFKGYQYLSSIKEVSEGCYEVVLTDEAPTLQTIREKVLAEIEAYDKSDEVNGFILEGRTMWKDKDERASLDNLIRKQKEAGEKETVLWEGSVRYTIPIDLATQMLSALELYAGECYNVTHSHIAEVEALQTIEEIEAYDYTTGYPERLVFTLNAE
jgi:hypothetical protein